MNFFAAKALVHNRGKPPDEFLAELVNFGRTAPEVIFAPNANKDDIYNKVKPELGPWEGLKHRTAVMLEVMRVLAMFESSADWKEGVDTSRLGGDTAENSEAGAWQVSYDARRLAPELSQLLTRKGITNGVQFQQQTKFDHPFAMEFVARLMRHNTRHNGPLYKAEERNAIRKSLRGAEHSIFPWLSKASVKELQGLLQA